MAQYLNLIILLVVVVVVFQKLKSLLGTRPTEIDNKITEEKAARIFDIIIKEAEKKNNTQPISSAENLEAVSGNLSETDKILTDIPNFNKDKFLDGAKRAFEIIINAFSKGDVSTLEMLVSKNLIKKFQEIINQRQADGVTAETDFIGFNSAEITAAKITKNDLAKITVKFISEQVNILKNKDNEVIEGDEQYIQNITDIWTFERNLTSTSPNWLLASTKK